MPQTFAPDDESQNLLGILALALGVSTVRKGLLLLPRLLDDMVCQLFGFTWSEKGELGSKPSSVRRLRVVRSEELGKRGPPSQEARHGGTRHRTWHQHCRGISTAPAFARTRRWTRRRHGPAVSTATGSAAQASRSMGDVELGGHVVLWYHTRPARGKPREAPACPL